MNRKNNKQSKPLEVKAFNFSSQPSELPIEKVKGGGNSPEKMIYLGQNNLYYNFLIGLYNDSPSHKAIINHKYNFIHGNGLIYANTDQYAEFKINERETIVDLFEKITKDFLIFNSYAIEVIYNKAGEQIRYNHIPINYLRMSKNRKHFWFCDDWFLRSNESIRFDAWSSNVNEDFTSKIYYYSAYTPSVQNTYPIPDYSGAIVSIENEIAIRDFHRNNLKTNFSVSSIITFFGGTPEDEVADKLLKDLENSYQGVNGKRMLVNFSDENGKGAEVTNVSSSDFNESFLTLRENTIEDIIIGHNVSSPALVGVAQAGQLGANQTMRDAYNQFRAQVILQKRNELLKSLNVLFNGYYNELSIEDDADRYGADEVDPLLKEIMTLNELREMKGLPKMEGGDNFLSNIKQIQNQPAPTVQESKFSKDSHEETEEISDETFSKIQHFGLEKDDFVVLRSYGFSTDLKFDSDQRLTNYLIANTPFAGNSLRGIQAQLDNEFTIQQIREELAKLVSTKVIPMTHLINREDIQDQARKLNVNPNSNNTSKIKTIHVMYSYEGPVDEKNRKFCSKLVSQNSNKLFTREEIEAMSQVLGFNIFQHKGGKNCRHSWVKHTVVRKS